MWLMDRASVNIPQKLPELPKNQTPQILPENNTNLNLYCANDRDQRLDKLILIYYNQGNNSYTVTHIHI